MEKSALSRKKAVLSINKDFNASAGNAGVNSGKEIPQRKLEIVSCLYSVTNLLIFLHGSIIVSKLLATCYILLLS